MDILIIIIMFLLGIFLIVKGGDFFVDAASWMAEISGIPKFIIGATIVSIATTLPEMLVSIIAAAQGKVDMSIGNAVGSVTANIGLIMAVSILFIPAHIRRRDYLPKSLLMLSAALIIVICGFFKEVNMLFAFILLVIFILFIYENIKSAMAEVSGPKQAGKKETNKTEVISNLVKFVIGAAGIVIGADLLVDNGSELARMIGVSERIIGVTLVAVGTSLPELVTTITAIVKKQSSLSLGNILGANIIDLTLIMPLSAFVSGKSLPIAVGSAVLDLPACLIVGLLAVIPAMISSKFRRWQGVALLIVYVSYVIITCTYVPSY